MYFVPSLGKTPQNSGLGLSESNKAGLIQTVPAFPGPVQFWAQGVSRFTSWGTLCVCVCVCVCEREVLWVTRTSVHSVDTETLVYILLMFIFMSLYFSLSHTHTHTLRVYLNVFVQETACLYSPFALNTRLHGCTNGQHIQWVFYRRVAHVIFNGVYSNTYSSNTKY